VREDGGNGLERSLALLCSDRFDAPQPHVFVRALSL
jgi:hypothetical protein